MAICSINSKEIVGKHSFNDQFKKMVTNYKIVGYSMNIFAAVCMPGYKPNHGL